MKVPFKSPTPSLEERIQSTRLACERFIDDKAAAIVADSPGLPISVVKNLLRNRSFGCDCAAAMAIISEQ
jgi:hypothetical protein